jgi:hypothetical protein
MKDFRFYLEFPSASAKKRSGRQHAGHAGNIFAAIDTFGDNRFQYPDHKGILMTEGLGAVFTWPNSPVASTQANVRGWLQPLCKRIPENLAREIHPVLFEHLDD